MRIQRRRRRRGRKFVQPSYEETVHLDGRANNVSINTPVFAFIVRGLAISARDVTNITWLTVPASNNTNCASNKIA